VVSGIRLGVMLLAAAALSLGRLGSASARTGATPKHGGTLVVGIPEHPGPMDPTAASGPYTVVGSSPSSSSAARASR
jgi:hypothetical protein